MVAKSAGILVFKHIDAQLSVFLVHPGGPFWAKKDRGAWSIPKGEFADDEPGLIAACREFYEEVGAEIAGDFMPLTPVRQRGGKMVHAWAVEGDIDGGKLRSNEFEMEWPPKSGLKQRFPEIDRGAWFPMAEARRRINPGQVPILDELAALLEANR